VCMCIGVTNGICLGSGSDLCFLGVVQTLKGYVLYGVCLGLRAILGQCLQKTFMIKQTLRVRGLLWKNRA
jgi:hypothetical protein